MLSGRLFYVNFSTVYLEEAVYKPSRSIKEKGKEEDHYNNAVKGVRVITNHDYYRNRNHCYVNDGK